MSKKPRKPRAKQKKRDSCKHLVTIGDGLYCERVTDQDNKSGMLGIQIVPLPIALDCAIGCDEYEKLDTVDELG